MRIKSYIREEGLDLFFYGLCGLCGIVQNKLILRYVPNLSIQLVTYRIQSYQFFNMHHKIISERVYILFGIL